MKMTINTSDIEIKIKLLKSEATLAQVTVILFGVWVEKGWRVSRSKNENLIYHDYVWVQPPCLKTMYGKWQEIVYIDDRQLYEEVHSKILDAYYREKNKENIVDEVEEITQEEVDKANA
jgi:hypothetical protein